MKLFEKPLHSVSKPSLRTCTSAKMLKDLDIQLKILQALPTLLQNYATELKGELLGSALHVCSILQSSKIGVVNNTATATMLQLLAFVFEKVSVEDSRLVSRTDCDWCLTYARGYIWCSGCRGDS